MPNDDAPPRELDRFNDVAKRYDDGRIPYAPALFKHVQIMAKLGPQSIVLDLGCGPGTIANRIADSVGKVIGVDPSPAMIEAARLKAPANASFLVGSSYDMSFIEWPLSLVTFGRSFHWMDRDETLRVLDRHVVPGGCLAFFSESVIAGKSTANAWWHAINKLILTFEEQSDLDKKLFGPDWERDEIFLARSPFDLVTYHGILVTHRWTYKRVLAYALSFSVSSPERLGDRLPEFEASLKKTLKRFGPGPWESFHQHRVMVARRR